MVRMLRPFRSKHVGKMFPRIDVGGGLQAAAGARAVGITVGTRYIHTVTEMIAKTDLQAALDILVAYLEET